MKKILLTLIIYHLSLTTSLAQTLQEKYNAQHPVTVVCDWDKPPYEFLDDKGKPSGSNIDVLNAVFRELKLPVKFVMKEWSIALKTFERGDADIILANARRYRNGKYAISENIINYNRVRVAMHTDSIKMISLKQLEREGAVFKPGDYSAYYFMDGDSLNNEHMEFQTPKVALMGLINGDYKYYVWGEEPLKWKIKELNLEGIVLNDVGIPISELHIIGYDQNLIEMMDDQYSRLKQSGEIAVLQDKWFHPERIQDESVPVALYIIIASIILTGLIYLFSRLAKAHVKNATRNFTELNEMMYKALHMGNFKVMLYDIRNDRITNRYGHILPDEGLTLEEFTSRIHPDQQQEFKQKMRRLMEGRERRFELNKRWNKGSEAEPYWLNFQGHAISELDNDGRPAYVVNAIHDVTQDIEENKAARELVRKYNRLTNIPFIAMSFYDKDGWLIDLNDSMKELCGMTDEDSDAKRFWETVCMFDVPLFRGCYSKDSREDMLFCQHMEYEEYGLDRYIECQIRPLFNADGDIANYFINTFDISEEQKYTRAIHEMMRQREETTRRSELHLERLRYLCVNSERHIMRSDIRTQTISFFRSPEAPEHVHAYEPFLEMLAEDDREPMRKILNDTETREQQQYTIHLIRQSKGQSGTIFSITFTPLFNETGKIIGHEGISSDITTLMMAQKQLELQTKVAKDSVKLKSGFMASMTHELRTPLNAIVGFTGVLESLADSPERGEYVRIIRNSSDMLQRLINDIIEASSLDDGNITISPKKVDFAHDFEDMCLMLEQRVKQQPEVEFKKDNPYESFLTVIDTERIQQILTNFVTNAVKFTKKGHIRVGYHYERQGLYIYCEDTGTGIPKEKQRMVFERFVKLDEFVQGTGMGLAISKSIINSFNGEIGVKSEGEGKGSTFWAWIPCERMLS